MIAMCIELIWEILIIKDPCPGILDPNQRIQPRAQRDREQLSIRWPPHSTSLILEYLTRREDLRDSLPWTGQSTAIDWVRLPPTHRSHDDHTDGFVRAELEPGYTFPTRWGGRRPAPPIWLQRVSFN